MRADITPWFIAFLVGVVVVLLMVISVMLLSRAVRTMTTTTKFYCPWVRRNVVVQYLTDEARHPVGVISCTAFADPIVVTCRRQCLTGGVKVGSATDQRVLDFLDA